MVQQKYALQLEIQGILQLSQQVFQQYQKEMKTKIDKQIQLIDPSLN